MRESTSLSIALLTHSVNPRGGVVHTLSLADALQRAGHAVTVIATARPGQSFFRASLARTALLPLPREPSMHMVDEIGARIQAFESGLADFPGRAHIDIWHTQDPIGGNALANLRARGLIPHFVRTVHHLDHFAEPQLAAWQERGFRAADRVLCVSRGWQERLGQVFGVDAGLVFNGVDTDRYRATPDASDAAVRARLGLRAGAPLVLSVGGVEERKNTVNLLDGFALLRADFPQAQWVIAGGASLLDHRPYARRFEERLAATGLRRGAGMDVVVTGPLDDADMPALYRSADVLAMPSLREGFGLVVLEALVSGTPVMVSDQPPFTEYLMREDVAWADPRDATSMARALKSALLQHDPGRVARSACRLAAKFDWHASARLHVDLYRTLLATGHARNA